MALNETFFVLAIVPGVLLGVWARSMLIRFAATGCYLLKGFWSIPENFVTTLFTIDFRHPAELMPGYHGNLVYATSTEFFKMFRTAPSGFDRIFRFIMIYPIFFIPVYGYRLSIKSTCWLYSPLVYVAGRRYSALTGIHLLDRLDRSPWERLRRYLALGTLTAFVLITALHNLSNVSEFLKYKSVSPLEFLFLVDFQFWKRPWQLCSLLSVIITIYLIGAAGHARVDVDHAIDLQSKSLLATEIEQIKLLMRVRDVFSAALVIILFVHALLLLSPVMVYLPNRILHGLNWFYGAYMPPYPQ